MGCNEEDINEKGEIKAYEHLPSTMKKTTSTFVKVAFFVNNKTGSK